MPAALMKRQVAEVDSELAAFRPMEEKRAPDPKKPPPFVGKLMRLEAQKGIWILTKACEEHKEKGGKASEGQAIGVIPIAVEHEDHLHKALRIYGEEIELTNAKLGPMVRLEIRPMDGANGKQTYCLVALAEGEIPVEEVHKPSLDPALKLDDAQVKQIVEKIDAQMPQIKEQMRKQGNSEAFADRFEDCTSFQKLEVLAWSLATIQDGKTNRLGQRYEVGVKGVKAPSQVFQTGNGDCDELSLALYGLAKQMGLEEADELSLVVVVDKNNPKDRPGHANLFLAKNGRGYILDLTHLPPVCKMEFEVGAALDENKELKKWELEQARRDQPEKEQIDEPIFRFFPKIQRYYHYMEGRKYYDEKRWKLSEKEFLQAGVESSDTLQMLAHAQANQGNKRYLDAAKTLLRLADMKPADREVRDTVKTDLILFIDKSNKEVELDYRQTALDMGVGDRNQMKSSQKRMEDYCRLWGLCDLAQKFLGQESPGFGIDQMSAKAYLAYSYELSQSGKKDQIDLERLKASVFKIDFQEHSVFSKMYSEIKQATGF